VDRFPDGFRYNKVFVSGEVFLEGGDFFVIREGRCQAASSWVRPSRFCKLGCRCRRI